MYLAKTPTVIQNLFPKLTWQMPMGVAKQEAPTLYLSFDDGPTPLITQWVLESLMQYQAKASFFCIGEQVQKHPQILDAIVVAGHSIGNHTYHHLNGWTTKLDQYISNIKQCAALVKSPLFRPPYGRIRPQQINYLLQHPKILQVTQTPQIIMWDVLSGDFDEQLSPEKCLANVLNNAQDGSIVVFHDNEKAQRLLQYVLPRILAHYAQKGYQFKAIPMHTQTPNNP